MRNESVARVDADGDWCIGVVYPILCYGQRCSLPLTVRGVILRITLNNKINSKLWMRPKLMLESWNWKRILSGSPTRKEILFSITWWSRDCIISGIDWKWGIENDGFAVDSLRSKGQRWRDTKLLIDNGSSVKRLQSLLTDLAKEIIMAFLRLNDAGVCTLRFDDTVKIGMKCDEEHSMSLFSAVIGKLPNQYSNSSTIGKVLAELLHL